MTQAIEQLNTDDAHILLYIIVVATWLRTGNMPTSPEHIEKLELLADELGPWLQTHPKPTTSSDD